MNMGLKQCLSFKFLSTMIFTNKPSFIMNFHHMFFKLILFLKLYFIILILIQPGHFFTFLTFNSLFMLPPYMFSQLIPIWKCHKATLLPPEIRTFKLCPVDLCGMLGSLMPIQMILALESLRAICAFVGTDVFMKTLHVSHQFVVFWKRSHADFTGVPLFFYFFFIFRLLLT